LRDEDLGDRPTASRALAHVLKSWPLDVPFTPSEFAAELNRRLGGKVRRKVDARVASSFLRRRRDEGIVHTAGGDVAPRGRVPAAAVGVGLAASLLAERLELGDHFEVLGAAGVSLRLNEAIQAQAVAFDAKDGQLPAVRD
jgi:hypothetical protein